MLFDGSPTLPSAVYAESDGRLLSGADAMRAARRDPGRFEPNPKRRIDEVDVLLGDAVYPVGQLVTATLRRVTAEVLRTVGDLPGTVLLTHPAGWGPTRRAVLTDAAAQAGLGSVTLVPEPVAAAAHFADMTDDGAVVVYDLGGGTCDVSVVQRTPAGFTVLAADGSDVGGLDLDWLIVEQIGAAVSTMVPAQWSRLLQTATPADHRLLLALRDDARAAKEMLSANRQRVCSSH